MGKKLTKIEILEALIKLPGEGLMTINKPNALTDILYTELRKLRLVYTQETHDRGIIAVGLSANGKAFLKKEFF